VNLTIDENHSIMKDKLSKQATECSKFRTAQHYISKNNNNPLGLIYNELKVSWQEK
jgi:hypothetical protein